MIDVKSSFGESLRRIRTEKGMSQQQIAELLYVDRSTVANWESGRRMPDYTIVTKLAKLLNVDSEVFLDSVNAEKPIVMMVDDEKIILTGGIPILKRVMPKAEIVGFTKASEALQYAMTHKVALAFLDIELRSETGLELCRKLLKVNPRMNIVFLTAYMDYSLDAWETGACGYLMKPLSDKKVEAQLRLLIYPVRGLK